MLQINPEALLDVAGAAYDSVVETVKSDALCNRWVNSIARGAALLIDNADFMTMRDDGTLVILSPESLEVYEVTEKGCECKAAKKHQPCKHAAARRLYKNYTATIH